MTNMRPQTLRHYLNQKLASEIPPPEKKCSFRDFDLNIIVTYENTNNKKANS